MNAPAPDIPPVCHRVRQLREQYAGPRGKAQLARELGLSPSTYDYYENGRVPPADVLVKLADLTGADLRWLITGVRAEATAVGADHPVLVRAAELLADRPGSAEALGAFLDLLAKAAHTFPTWPAGTADRASQTPPPALDAPPPAAEARGEAGPADAPPAGPMVPILGRSAAGVPAFWAEPAEAAGVTDLAELVARLPADANACRPASLCQGPGREQPVRIVRYDRPQAAGTSEFVSAEPLAGLPGPLFAVRLDGQSMEPEYRHGDLLILSPRSPAEPGKPAVVQLAAQIGVTCKLYRPDADTVHLIPLNEHYPTTAHPAADLQWALRVLARVRPA